MTRYDKAITIKTNAFIMKYHLALKSVLHGCYYDFAEP